MITPDTKIELWQALMSLDNAIAKNTIKISTVSEGFSRMNDLQGYLDAAIKAAMALECERHYVSKMKCEAEERLLSQIQELTKVNEELKKELEEKKSLPLVTTLS